MTIRHRRNHLLSATPLFSLLLLNASLGHSAEPDRPFDNNTTITRASASAQSLQAATKAVALIEKTMDAIVPNVPCASCHHHMLPVWAFAHLRHHGVPIHEAKWSAAVRNTYGFLTDVDRAITGTRFVDPALEGAELLAFTRDIGLEPSFTTALHARRLATLQQPEGHWLTFDSRPPQSYSLFMTTALSAKSLAEHLPASLRTERDVRLARALAWLRKNQPHSNEDLTFRLLGLAWTGASLAERQRAAQSLLATQGSDGGWSQVPGRAADAYATGQALAALRLSGLEKAKSPSFVQSLQAARERGVAFLVASQLADGSWLVKTRLHSKAPISPPYMETGFPHGKDQIISLFGTTWATLALALELPVRPQEAVAADMPARLSPEMFADLRPRLEPWMEQAAFGPLAALDQVSIAARTPNGSTPLMAAAHDPQRVQRLLARGADAAALTRQGHTVLSTAATYGGAAQVLQMLLAAGASAAPVKTAEFHENPLVYSAMANDAAAVKVLLSAGASATQPMLLQGLVRLSPVSAAVAVDSPAVLELLLRHGVSPNHAEDIPLLSQAALQNRPRVARLLRKAGADPVRIDKFHWTAANHAHAIEHDQPLVSPSLLAPQ